MRYCCPYICYSSLAYLPSLKSFYILYWHNFTHNWRDVCWKALTFATLLAPWLCSYNASSLILSTTTKCGKAVGLNTHAFQLSHTLWWSRLWQNEQKYLVWGLVFFCFLVWFGGVFCVCVFVCLGFLFLFFIHCFCKLQWALLWAVVLIVTF